MRTLLPLVTLAIALAFSAAALADDAPLLANEQGLPKEELEALHEGVIHDPCFGDRHETDAELNEGNTITEEEILLLINPPST